MGKMVCRQCFDHSIFTWCAKHLKRDYLPRTTTTIQVNFVFLSTPEHFIWHKCSNAQMQQQQKTTVEKTGRESERTQKKKPEMKRKTEQANTMKWIETECHRMDFDNVLSRFSRFNALPYYYSKLK